MPIPIKPVHSLDLHAEIFDGPSMESLGLSAIQIQMLGLTDSPKREASIKVSEKYIDILKNIDQNIDEVVTAANSIMNRVDSKICNVPTSISDNDLLALKTAGLLSGHGRSVELTEKAKLALRDHYLSTDTTNEFRKARTKEKFDLEAAKNVKVSNSKFRKVASWLNNDEFRDEFIIRFIADNDETRSKGLMHAEPLEEYEVAVFKFPYAGCYSFWNKNVDFPLSLAFLNKDYEIVDFKNLQKQSPKSVSPESNDVVYVIEAKINTFDDLKIKKGDKLKLKGKKLVLLKD